jgi:hypothetical protein
MSQKMFNMDKNIFTGEKQPVEMASNPERGYQTVLSKKERKQQRLQNQAIEMLANPVNPAFNPDSLGYFKVLKTDFELRPEICRKNEPYANTPTSCVQRSLNALGLLKIQSFESEMYNNPPGPDGTEPSDIDDFLRSVTDRQDVALRVVYPSTICHRLPSSEKGYENVALLLCKIIKTGQTNVGHAMLISKNEYGVCVLVDPSIGQKRIITEKTVDSFILGLGYNIAYTITTVGVTPATELFIINPKGGNRKIRKRKSCKRKKSYKRKSCKRKRRTIGYKMRGG